MDHARAFGHSGEGVDDVFVVRTREGECGGEEFWKGVGGADGAGGLEPGGVGGGEAGEGRGDRGEDLVDREALTYYARGHDDAAVAEAVVRVVGEA